MSLDEQLRTTLREMSVRPDRPAPDVRSLVAGGEALRRREQVRRLGVAAGSAAACVVALVLGLTVAVPRDVGEDRIRSTVPALPVGAPPALPHCRGGDTIVGAGEPIRTACMPMTSHAGTTIGWNRNGVYLIGGGRLDLLSDRLPSRWLPALSHDGRYAAWVVGRPQPALLVFDRYGRQVADVDMPTAAAWTAGIDARGRVFVTALPAGGPMTIWMYDIASQRLHRVRGLPGFEPGGIKYVTADGIGLDLGHFTERRTTGHTALGTVDDRGRFGDRGIVPVGWSSWSPDFSRLVQETADGYWVQDADDLDHHVRLDLPEGTPATNPVWEDGDSLLVVFHADSPDAATGDVTTRGDESGGTWLLRCSATTGACEVALEPGYDGDLHEPMYH